MNISSEILERIPQRPPFIFIEKIIEKSEDRVITSLDLTGDEDFFKGHFPDNPIMPGVLMCEACFQTGALLMSYREGTDYKKTTAVVTRVQNAKFKHLVRPKCSLKIDVRVSEEVHPAVYMKGIISSNGKKVMTIDFAVSAI